MWTEGINNLKTFLNYMNSIHPTINSILVTLDVSSLYTDIPHREGVEACRHFLNTRPHKSLPTEIICDLMHLILGMNNFTNHQHFLQIHGTAMGTRVAPSYANLFMGKLKQRAIENTPLKHMSGGDLLTIYLSCGQKE